MNIWLFCTQIIKNNFLNIFPSTKMMFPTKIHLAFYFFLQLILQRNNLKVFSNVVCIHVLKLYICWLYIKYFWVNDLIYDYSQLLAIRHILQFLSAQFDFSQCWLTKFEFYSCLNLFCTDTLQKGRKSHELGYYIFAQGIREVHADFEKLVCNLPFGTVSELPKPNVFLLVNKNILEVKISMHQNKFGIKPSFKIEILHSLNQ